MHVCIRMARQRGGEGGKGGGREEEEGVWERVPINSPKEESTTSLPSLFSQTLLIHKSRSGN